VESGYRGTGQACRGEKYKKLGKLEDLDIMGTLVGSPFDSRATYKDVFRALSVESDTCRRLFTLLSKLNLPSDCLSLRLS